MSGNMAAQANDHLKFDDKSSNSGDDNDHSLNHYGKRDRATNNKDDDSITGPDSSEHGTKKRDRKSDTGSNDNNRHRDRDRQSEDKKSKKKKRNRHDKKKKRHRDESSDSTGDSDSDEEYRRTRKRDRRKKSKKEKKHSRHRRHEESNDDGKGTNHRNDDTTATVRRSVITGEKIQLKIDKTADDVIQEQARKQLLDFMNASYK